ncbi:hypothetical protein F511_40295 [Dorcoceras hygrometricum]|uniref:Uncharacterized protein n=1 Tax=Dorcoceras hygrometricum TaxID=472368 RepID=A0A2Z7BLA6_9LAMI|nr:hypothetical protein F511_40295 [Dorcoceras hygrometricum]
MGIDQLALHSVQLGYLKILQVGNTDPKDTKAGKEIRGPISPSLLGGRNSNPAVTTPMIALDFSGTTHLSANHNVALNRDINQSMWLKIFLKARHNSTFADQLSPGFLNPGRSYPKPKSKSYREIKKYRVPLDEENRTTLLLAIFSKVELQPPIGACLEAKQVTPVTLISLLGSFSDYVRRFLGYSAGRGVDPAGGDPGSGLTVSVFETSLGNHHDWVPCCWEIGHCLCRIALLTALRVG